MRWEEVFEEMRGLAQRHSLELALPPPATAERIAQTGAFSVEYRELLALHDGLVCGHLRILSTSDFLDESELYRKARVFIDESASYGNEEIGDSVPIANLGQPNDWLLFDRKRERFVVWLNADDLVMESLLAAVAHQVRLLAEIHGGHD